MSAYVPVDQVYLGTESPLMPLDFKKNAEAPNAAGLSMHECSRLDEEQAVIQQTYKKEIIVSGSPVINNVVQQTKLNLSSQSDMKKVEIKVDNQDRLPAVTFPRYLNLEPSLAMDWLEISWEELHIKERVGAGTFSAACLLL